MLEKDGPEVLDVAGEQFEMQENLSRQTLALAGSELLLIIACSCGRTLSITWKLFICYN